ncbi:hypothetical protein GN157_05160 [Flavobacterium rakeshii]|uniref:Lipocalin-like domain-containing protein n=1 Tax=Flavobacterium rakeshii TaxID=1038845 RepID=A0A6N8HAW9_9FLAO|nr:hypothetical protein [Flavobacterium rakeshii]MUV03093.1 hypothetical protein [Flavobacterium rakeshii]
MNHAKKGFLKLASLILLTSLIACSEENDVTASKNDSTTTPPTIFATWKATGFIYDGVYSPITDECQQEIMTINSDGTALSTKNCPDGIFHTEYTWTLVEGDVYAFDSESTYWPVNYKLTFPIGNDKMYFTYAKPQPHEFSKIYEKVEVTQEQSRDLAL